MRHPLTSGKFRAALSNDWPDLCTIRVITTTTTAVGQKLTSGYSDVSGMINLKCRLAPFIETRMTDDMRRMGTVTSRIIRRTCKLNAYLPQIDPVRNVAVIGSIVYQIEGVESDSEKFSTRLRLELETP